MIYIILGTKGQFMKMFPLLKKFDKYKIPYKFVHTGQHYGIIEENIKRFNIKEPDVYLTIKKEDLKNIWEMLRWAPKVLWNARGLNIKKSDCVIVHGDTESTLLGLFIGFYFRAKLVHIESGLRSGDIFNPFPEEIIRNITSYFADVCFCPSEKDSLNIKGKKTVVVTNGNTIFDSIKIALSYNPSADIEKTLNQKYVLFLSHRKENFFSKKSSNVILKSLEKILQNKHKVIWVLHANTEYELKSKNLWNKVLFLKSHYDVTLISHFLDYVDFMHLVKNSQFVVSDGGGLQEETYFLNKPILILRKKTERDWGLGETAYLSYLDDKKISYFLEHVNMFKRKSEVKGSPSEIIVHFFRKNPQG